MRELDISGSRRPRSQLVCDDRAAGERIEAPAALFVCAVAHRTRQLGRVHQNLASFLHAAMTKPGGFRRLSESGRILTKHDQRLAGMTLAIMRQVLDS